MYTLKGIGPLQAKLFKVKNQGSNWTGFRENHMDDWEAKWLLFLILSSVLVDEFTEACSSYGWSHRYIYVGWHVLYCDSPGLWT